MRTLQDLVRSSHFHESVTLFDMTKMMQHLYSLEEVLQYTVKELDAYLLTKDWACDSIDDKRRAVLLFLNDDGLLTPTTVAYVTAPTFAIHSLSVDRADEGTALANHTPILCLTHATRTLVSFRRILEAGVIQPYYMLQQGRDQYPGVYMTPYMANFEFVLRVGIAFVFSPSLLDRGDFHFDPEDLHGYISDRTLSLPTMGQLHTSRLNHTAEVVFHHPVRIDTTDRLIGIWVTPQHQKGVQRAITKIGRTDLLDLIIVLPDDHTVRFTPDLVRDHAWVKPMEPLNPRFCTPYIGNSMSGPRDVPIATLAKVVVNCGYSPEQINTLLEAHCQNHKECSEALLSLIRKEATSILNGTKPEIATTYYPPFHEMELIGVHLPPQL